MIRKRSAYLHIVILPFVVSASFEFLPAWLYLPIVLIGGMSWFGACAIVAEKEKTYD
jgi:uncharacterized membrane protein YdbT with pleckstrin-like domain